jgi:dGTPase
MPFEAHLVDHCDKIAYLSHDLDDGLRAGMFAESEAATLRLWQLARSACGSDNRQRIVSEVASLLIHDLVETTDAAIAAAPSGGEAPRVQHGGAMTVMAHELLEFLRARFYRAPRVLAVMHEGAERIRTVFAALVAEPARLTPSAQARIERDGLHRATCDYVAGMTDRYLGRIAAAL